MKPAGRAPLIALALAGCCASARDTPPAVALIEYPPHVEAAVADELERCADACSTVGQIVADYVRLRCQIRAIQGAAASGCSP